MNDQDEEFNTVTFGDHVRLEFKPKGPHHMAQGFVARVYEADELFLMADAFPGGVRRLIWFECDEDGEPVVSGCCNFPDVMVLSNVFRCLMDLERVYCG